MSYLERPPAPDLRASLRPQEPESSKGWRTKATVLAGAVAIAAAGVHSLNSSEAASTSFMPEQIHVEGSIDAGQLHTQLAMQPEFSKQQVMDQTGTSVVKLVEFTPSRGLKSTGNTTELRGSAMIAGISPQIRKDLDEVVTANAGTLNRLVEADQLAGIRFNIAVNPDEPNLNDLPAGDMRYIRPSEPAGSPEGSILEYTLPPKGGVSKEVMSVMVGHEAEHISQSIFQGLVNSKDPEASEMPTAERPFKVDSAAYREDLRIIRKASIDVAEKDPEVIAAAQALLQTTAHSQTALADGTRKIAQSILDGTFDQLQPTQENPGQARDFEVDEGRLSNPGEVLGMDLDLTLDQEKQQTPEQREAMKALSRTFEAKIATNKDSAIAVFNERTYFSSDEKSLSSYGHGQDNASEAAAGAANITRLYPRKFAHRLKNFPQSVKNALIGFAERVHKDTSAAQALRGAISTESKNYNKQTDDTMAWIKENS